MTTRRLGLTIGGGLLLCLLLLAPRLVGAQDGTSHAMDEALLLMMAGQSRLYDDYAPVAVSGVPGAMTVARPRSAKTQALRGASRNEINEKRLLASAYREWAERTPSSSAAQQFLATRAMDHENAAEELARARRRYLRRHNNIFRRLGRGIVRPVAHVGRAVFRGGRWVFRGMGEIGEVVLIIARDEIVIRAKNIVRAKVQDLIDIGRGRLDAVLSRIARKYGWPAAELLREFVVNPAFSRLRAQIQRDVDRLVGEGSSEEGTAPETEASTEEEYQPDFTNVDEEQGDTDYDEDDTSTDESGGAPWDEDQQAAEEGQEADQEAGEEEEVTGSSVTGDAPLVYDISTWFSEADCSRFNGLMPNWMESTDSAVTGTPVDRRLVCHWNTSGEQLFCGDPIPSNCPFLPGRVEVDIHAFPSAGEAMSVFRANTSLWCGDVAGCRVEERSLFRQETWPEKAYASGIGYGTRSITVMNNVIIDLWWGGSEERNAIDGLLPIANALVESLQR